MAKSQGTKLMRGSGVGQPETFAAVAKVNNISGPGMSRDSIEVTTHDSEAKEFIPGLVDGGELKLELTFDPANASHVALLDDLVDDGVVHNWQLIFPDTAQTTWEFAGFVTNFEPGAPVNGKLTASVSIKITGLPTFGVA